MANSEESLEKVQTGKMKTIIVGDIHDLEQRFLQLVKISFKLRHYKKKWDVEYGATNRMNLARWEEKMDEFLVSLNIKEDPGMAPNDNVPFE